MGVWEAWQSATLIIVFVSFLLFAFTYMIGVGFMLPRVKAWAKNEFYQAVASALIAGSMVALILFTNSVTNAIAGGPACPGLCCSCDDGKYPEFCSPNSPDPIVAGSYSATFDYAKCYMDGNRNLLLVNYGVLLFINLKMALRLSEFRFVAPFQQGVTFPVYPGLATVTDFLGLIMTMIGGGAILLTVNSMVLDFIRYKLMALLPIGVGLRAFPFTRGAGAALMALVVGFYVLYPMLFFLDSLIFERDTANFAGFMGATSDNPAIQLILDLLSSLYYPIYVIAIVGIFLPLFNLTITISFTREFSRFLGGDMDLSSLTKLL